MNQKALSSSPTNVGVRQTPIMSIKGTPILSREKTRGIPTIYGCGHHVRVDIGGRVVLASCHRRLFARRIGLVPVRQSQRLAYDRGLAHGDPDRRRRQPLRYHTPLGQGVTIRQRRLRQLPHGASHTDKHDRRI